MSESADRQKIAKKKAKAETKRLKKLGKHQGTEQAPRAAASSPQGMSAAERSAAAAEGQLRLQQHRVWLALATALIALATLLATVRPWERILQPETPNEITTAEEGATQP